MKMTENMIFGAENELWSVSISKLHLHLDADCVDMIIMPIMVFLPANESDKQFIQEATEKKAYLSGGHYDQPSLQSSCPAAESSHHM